jgi:hypothetical protein
MSDKDTAAIKEELELLRSFAISIVGRDREGAYRPKFVERVLKASKKSPTYTFESSEKFLKDLKRFT